MNIPYIGVFFLSSEDQNNVLLPVFFTSFTCVGLLCWKYTRFVIVSSLSAHKESCDFQWLLQKNIYHNTSLCHFWDFRTNQRFHSPLYESVDY